MLDRWFFEHPRSIGESYGEHLRVAGGFGLTMIVAGLACLVHAIVPGLFVRTGSVAIAHLHDRMVRNRAHAPAPLAPSATAGNEPA